VGGFLAFSVYFRQGERVAGYYNFFSGTHRLFAASDRFIIKDTYYTFLDIFIALALISSTVFLIMKIRTGKKAGN
jgi:hypothetical protein